MFDGHFWVITDVSISRFSLDWRVYDIFLGKKKTRRTTMNTEKSVLALLVQAHLTQKLNLLSKKGIFTTMTC